MSERGIIVQKYGGVDRIILKLSNWKNKTDKSVVDFTVGKIPCQAEIYCDEDLDFITKIVCVGPGDIFVELLVAILDYNHVPLYTGATQDDFDCKFSSGDEYEIETWKQFGEGDYENVSKDDLPENMLLQITMVRLDGNNSNSKTIPKPLFSDFYCLLLDGLLVDFTIVTSTQRVGVHKVILAARSQVFRAMLSNGMQESIKNEIVISDFDAEIVQYMLTYIYTDTCDAEVLKSKCEEIYAIAQKYQIIGLIALCMMYLIDTMSVENCVDRLLFADSHGSEEFVNIIVEFIADHRKDICGASNDFLKRIPHELKDKILLSLLAC